VGENRWANDIDGSALAAQPGKSQGRPLKSPGSKPIAQSGLPNLRSPEGPCPSRPNLSRRPDDTGTFTEQFHAARSGIADGGRVLPGCAIVALRLHSPDLSDPFA
jgi:hypothetical protein